MSCSWLLPQGIFGIEQHALLQGNVLRSTKGIQMLPHLEELDLRYNLIASIHEVVRLSGALYSPRTMLPKVRDLSAL